MDTLIVTTNDQSFDYDIHSLVKAFFPECEVRLLRPEDAKDVSSSEGFPDINIEFNEDMVFLTIIDKESKGLKIPISKDLERGVVKNLVKRLIYSGLSEHTGRTLPWGTLTGIRPVKIPMMLLDDASDEEISEYMKEVYLVGDEKLKLSLDIAKREKRILSSIDHQNGYSLYVGIPFCPTRCLYCSFASYPIEKCRNKVDPYLEALFKEIDYVSDLMNGRAPDTVYIGGGTPTALDEERLDRLLTKIGKRFDLSDIKEFTVEAGRPTLWPRNYLGVFARTV